LISILYIYIYAGVTSLLYSIYMDKENILISNDDGVIAVGIKCLSEYLGKAHNVTVVAPCNNCSGASSSLTLNRPLYPEYLTDNTIAINGTPADSVHLAITGLLPKLPDRVISGINRGMNMGDDAIYSGTVGAALEGRVLAKTAIAVSLVGDKNFLTAAKVLSALLDSGLLDSLPQGIIVNINVPDVEFHKLAGIQLTRLGKRHKADNVHTGIDPRGRKHYWIGAAGNELDCSDGTDFSAVSQGFVSVTPLQIDMTAYSGIMPELQRLFSQFEL
jgi:5'-nucleotidase